MRRILLGCVVANSLSVYDNACACVAWLLLCWWQSFLCRDLEIGRPTLDVHCEKIASIDAVPVRWLCRFNMQLKEAYEQMQAQPTTSGSQGMSDESGTDNDKVGQAYKVFGVLVPET